MNRRFLIPVFPAVVGALLLAFPKTGLGDENTRFSFRGEHEDAPLTLHVQDDWAVSDGWLEPKWKPVCSSPCSSALPPGAHRVALSPEGGATVEAERRVRLTEPSVLRGSYESNAGIRTAGYITMIGIPAVMLLPNLSGTESCDVDDCSGSDDDTSKYVRLGVGVAGFIAGLVMTLVDDKAWVTVVALTTGQGDAPSAALEDHLGPLGAEAAFRF